MSEESLTQLGEIYSSGALPNTPDLRAARLLAGLLDLVDGDVGFLGTVTAGGDALEVFRVTRFSERVVRLAFPLDAPYPLAYAVRTEQPLYIANNEQLRCDHPGLVRVESADHACVTVPLHDADGRLLGAINVSFEEPHAFTDDERLLVDAIARRCVAVLASD